MKLEFLEADNGVHASRAAVVGVMDDKVLYVKKRGKSTLELPTAEVPDGEEPNAAAERMLTELLNVDLSSLRFVTLYSVESDGSTEYGALFYAEITSMRTLNDPALCGSYFLNIPPEDKEKWTFPDTDIPLLEKATGK